MNKLDIELEWQCSFIYYQLKKTGLLYIHRTNSITYLKLCIILKEKI